MLMKLRYETVHSSRDVLGLLIPDKCDLEQSLRSRVKHDDALGVIEAGNGHRSFELQPVERVTDVLATKLTLIEHRHSVHADLQQRLQVELLRVAVAWRVEQGEPLVAVLEAVAALNTVAPPLTEVQAGTERVGQLVAVREDPRSEASVVPLRSDDLLARLGIEHVLVH